MFDYDYKQHVSIEGTVNNIINIINPQLMLSNSKLMANQLGHYKVLFIIIAPPAFQ